MRGVIVALLALSFVCGGVFSGTSLAAEAKQKRISLPAPQIKGGKPLMEALAARSSNRSFSAKAVDSQMLSNLLWATWGINRPDGRRTAPTATNSQDIFVYVALDSGVWLYDAQKNELTQALSQDVREKFGGAPVTLLYVAPPNRSVSGFHAGALFQNAGLFCASEGLANVVKVTGRNALKDDLVLPEGYEVLVIQSVGWPR